MLGLSIALLMGLSFGGFGYFYYHIDANNRTQRNLAEIRLAALSRALAVEVGFTEANKEIVSIDDMREMANSLQGPWGEGEELTTDIERDVAATYLHKHLNFPYKPNSLKNPFNFVAFGVFIAGLIAAFSLLFFLLEPAPNPKA